MAVVLRLMRIGKKGFPFYRIVAVDKRKKRNGAYLDEIGSFNPLSNPESLIIDQNKYNQWLAKGACLSE